MGTVEKAREYARNGMSLYMDTSDEQDIYCEDLIQAYLAGAKSEREELTRWHDSKCPPVHRKPVLIKGVTPSGRKCLVVGVFYKSGLQTNTYYKVDPIGWREIHE